MQQIYFAIKQIIKKPSYLFLCAGVAMAFLILLIAVPVISIPGNNLAFRLSIFSMRNYILMAFLAVLFGLNLTLQVYSFRQKQDAKKLSQSVAGGASSGIAGIFGAVVGTAACSSCLAFLFGLIGLGTGSVFFVLKNQSYFLIGTIAVMLISLYLSARKINKVCVSC